MYPDFYIKNHFDFYIKNHFVRYSEMKYCEMLSSFMHISLIGIPIYQNQTCGHICYLFISNIYFNTVQDFFLNFSSQLTIRFTSTTLDVGYIKFTNTCLCYFILPLKNSILCISVSKTQMFLCSTHITFKISITKQL